MEITVFAKKKQTKTGKVFYTYLTTLMKKDGTEDKMEVKFREEAGIPDSFPCNLVINREDCNVSKKLKNREDTGEVFETRTLWVTKWTQGTPYIDTSLDDYDI